MCYSGEFDLRLECQKTLSVRQLRKLPHGGYGRYKANEHHKH